jgi:pimeloyl-ACP methyl ester carboxylesterase
MRYIYLHGFASSPQSSKAQYFAARFAERGLNLRVPALDDGDFEKLTLSRQLRIVEREAGGDCCVLIGSSMGGYVAALAAARMPHVQKLVLLAPAFAFPSRWRDVFGPEKLARWKSEGAIALYHYGERRERLLGYQLIEDAAGFEDFPDFQQPALILHGLRDDVVPVSLSEAFAATHAHVRLQAFESGHELTDVLPGLWAAAEEFLFGSHAGRGTLVGDSPSAGDLAAS